jgi:hypothetical protein
MHVTRSHVAQPIRDERTRPLGRTHSPGADAHGAPRRGSDDFKNLERLEMLISIINGSMTVKTTRPNVLYLHSHDAGRHIEPYGEPVPTPDVGALADPNAASSLTDDERSAAIAADLRGRLQRWMFETDDPLLAGPVDRPPGVEIKLLDQRSATEPTTRIG